MEDYRLVAIFRRINTGTSLLRNIGWMAAVGGLRFMENVQNRRTFLVFTGNRNEVVLLVSSELITCLFNLV